MTGEFTVRSPKELLPGPAWVPWDCDPADVPRHDPLWQAGKYIWQDATEGTDAGWIRPKGPPVP